MRPDGHAETTYRLRKNATFHDGTPITAGDFVFAQQLHTDPALPMTKVDVDRRMAAVRAIDEQTLFIEWNEPYLWAGTIYGPNFSPLPRHLLEESYLADKATFANGLHWSREFVGSGPFKLERWEQGIEMTLRAHDRDSRSAGRSSTASSSGSSRTPNAIVANLLGRTIDASWHSSISFAQNRALESAGWRGTTEYWPGSAHYLEFQTRDWGNLQRAVLDARVRKALIHAVDRRAIVEDLYAGKAQIYDYWLSDDDPAYAAVSRSVAKHNYDVGRALALLAEAGWTRGGDGLLRNAAGELLNVPIVSQNEDMDQQQATIVADNWKTLGVTPEVVVMTSGQQRDNEFRPRLRPLPTTTGPLATTRWCGPGDRFPWSENRWRGNNYSGYSNAAARWSCGPGSSRLTMRVSARGSSSIP